MHLKTQTNDELRSNFPHLVGCQETEDRIYFFSTYTGDTIPGVHPPTHISMIGDDNYLIGDAFFNLSPDDHEEFVLQYVSVDPEYQNQGIGRKILMAVFEHIAALKGDYRINLGGFSVEGDEYLRSMVNDAVKEYPGMISAEPDDQTFEQWLNNEPIQEYGM